MISEPVHRRNLKEPTVAKSLASIPLLFLLPMFVPNTVVADEQTDRRIAELERHIQSCNST